MRVIRQSQIDDEFVGFDEDMLFKLTDGTYWLQSEYRYWYHYAYRPAVEILEHSGRYFLRLAGDANAIAVIRTNDVIESYIDGEFQGWQGESTYTLGNGQIWKQSRYKYEYRYAYRPQVVVYPGGGYIMHVDGTQAHVTRVR
jgi:hypothetical protein